MPRRSSAASAWLLPKPRFGELLNLLRADGYETLGPRVEQAAIVYGSFGSPSDLPIGWTDEQAPGRYRLARRDDQKWFGYAVGPHSWKKHLFPPTLRLWRSRKSETGLEIVPEEHDPPKLALVGVRSCELHAIATQDLTFINEASGFSDPHYRLARERLFLIAVECQDPAETCFCASMETGPGVDLTKLAARAASPAGEAPRKGRRQTLPMAGGAERRAPLATCDLILTELEDAFVVRTASSAGEALVERLRLTPASWQEQDEARQGVAAAAEALSRRVDGRELRELLHRNQEHPRWTEVADCCLACANCTMVCPTCFCSSLEDTSDLGQESAERTRIWDSCFNPEFARVHGGNYRPSIRGRYRQWLTHKFASWFDQFGVSGCVGCGRCIAWCPVGIDVTEEIAAIRATDGQREGAKT